MRVLRQTEDSVTVAVEVTSPEESCEAGDPNVARITFSRSDVEEYHNCIKAMESCGWSMMKNYDYRTEWLYDEEYEPLKSDPANWRVAETRTEADMIRLWREGDIYFSAYIKHTDLTLTCGPIKLSDIETLFKAETAQNETPAKEGKDGCPASPRI